VNQAEGSANFGNELARRPENAFTLSADWSGDIAGQEFNIGGDARIVSDSFDDAANATPLDGYAIFTIRANVPIGDNFELYGRVENIFDEDYQTAAGFATPGRGGFVGVRAKF